MSASRSSSRRRRGDRLRFEWDAGPARRARPASRRPAALGARAASSTGTRSSASGCSRRVSATAGCWRSRRCCPPAPRATARSWSPGRSATATARRVSSTRRCSRPSTAPTARCAGSGSSSTRRWSRLPIRVAGDVACDRAVDRRRRRAGLGDRRDSRRRRQRRPRPARRRALRTPQITAVDLRLRRRPDHAADALLRRLSGPHRDLDRVARPRDAGDRRARRRAPAVRARDGADHRGRLPRPARGRRSSPSSATGPRCTASSEIYFEALEPNEPMIELMRELKAQRPADGAADQQRARVGAAVALDAAGRRDLRVRRRLGLRRDAQARPADLRADARAPRRRRRRAAACSSTTSLVNVEAARAIGMHAVHFRDNEQAIPRDPRRRSASAARNPAAAALR